MFFALPRFCVTFVQSLDAIFVQSRDVIVFSSSDLWQRSDFYATSEQIS
jgi:hypothetical protein